MSKNFLSMLIRKFVGGAEKSTQIKTMKGNSKPHWRKNGDWAIYVGDGWIAKQEWLHWLQYNPMPQMLPF